MSGRTSRAAELGAIARRGGQFGTDLDGLPGQCRR